MDCDLRFEFSNTPFRGGEFGVLGGREAGLEPGVDSRLSAPGVDRLLADLEFIRDLGDLSAPFNQI